MRSNIPILTPEQIVEKIILTMKGSLDDFSDDQLQEVVDLCSFELINRAKELEDLKNEADKE
jgi:hypothetical protein